ncbi:MAG: alpha/beta fold hydrolase [Nitrososphaeraceae archaeon]
MNKVKVNDIDIAYKIYESGNNNTILLIGGSGQTMNAWEPFLIKKLVESNNSVIVFDNRGIGNTTKGIKPFSIKQFAYDTIELLEKLGIDKKIDILGFSTGSLIAQEIALNHPEKIRKLILYASTCSVRKDDDANDATVQDKKIVNIFFTLRNQVMLKICQLMRLIKKYHFCIFQKIGLKIILII